LTRVFNLFDSELSPDPDTPPGHRFNATSLTRDVGARFTGLGVYELPSGEAGWPYHFELNEEEWVVVVSGEVVLRTPRGEETLKAGDVVCFPVGADGAHALRNESEAPARFALLSAFAPGGAVAVYPDSNKVFVSGRRFGFSRRMYIGAEVPYWEGEP